MPLKVIQFRGGTAVEHEVFVGHDREITVNTTTKRLHVHDGETKGGHPLANEADVPTKTSQLQNDVYRGVENLTKLSDLTEDIQYLKKEDLTRLSQLENDSGYIAGHCTYCSGYCTYCTNCS